MNGYSKAENKQLSPNNYWAGYDNRDFIVVHATASGNNATEYVPNFEGSGKSTHYAIAMDGHIVQYVDENDSAWGNCCATGTSAFSHTYNWNKSTISIENEKHSDDNSTPLTDAQYQSLLLLVRDIANRWNIPLQHGAPGVRGVIFHHDIDPVNKSGCPGTFPYDTFFQDLAQKGDTTTMTIQLNSNGNVCDCWRWYQIETEQLPNVPGSPQGQQESGDLCGPGSIALLATAGQPGKGATLTVEAVDRFADDRADKWWGSHYGSLGASIENMHQFVRDTQAGIDYVDPDGKNVGKFNVLHYWDIAPDINAIRAAIQAGYPVVITASEGNIIRKDDGQQAYGWNVGSHVIPLTGVDADGDFHSPDQMADPKKAWPPTYLASKLQPTWASIIQLPFLKPIPSGNPLDASWKNFNAQNFAGGAQPVPPTPTPPAPTQNTNVRKAFETEWTAIQPQAMLNSGIAGMAWADYQALKFRGPALTLEFDSVDWSRNPLKVQVTPAGRYEWNLKNSTGTFVPFSTAKR